MSEILFTAKPNIEQNGFYFQRPEIVSTLSNGANIARVMGAMASRLVSEERTRTIHPDGRAENVAEHGFMLAKVATELAREMYPNLDPGGVALAAIGHDDVEAYVCDTATDRITEAGRLEKTQREARGLEQLVKEYSAITPGYARDVHDYEKQNDPHDRFVRVVDKIMVLLIHIPNDGATLKENYTYEEFMMNTKDSATRLLAEYPEYSALVELRTELAGYLADKYLLTK